MHKSTVTPSQSHSSHTYSQVLSQHRPSSLPLTASPVPSCHRYSVLCRLVPMCSPVPSCHRYSVLCRTMCSICSALLIKKKCSICSDLLTSSVLFRVKWNLMVAKMWTWVTIHTIYGNVVSIISSFGEIACHMKY